MSLVTLSLQLPFALTVLGRFVGQRPLMGDFALGGRTRIASWRLALLILPRNIMLIFETLA